MSSSKKWFLRAKKARIIYSEYIINSFYASSNRKKGKIRIFFKIFLLSAYLYPDFNKKNENVFQKIAFHKKICYNHCVCK